MEGERERERGDSLGPYYVFLYSRDIQIGCRSLVVPFFHVDSCSCEVGLRLFLSLQRNMGARNKQCEFTDPHALRRKD